MKLTNLYDLPKEFTDVVESLVYDPSESDPKRIGVTTLINPPRQRLLTVRHWNELQEDMSNHIWRIMGNACHYILSKVENEHRLVEEKIEHEVNGITIVAKPDAYDDKTKCISDWKITSVFSFRLGDKIAWEQQLNSYAWSLRKFGLEVNKIHIHAILRDWSKGESLRYKDYPPIAFQKVEVKLWSYEEQCKFIEDRVKEYKIALNLADDELPICDEVSRWKSEDVYAIYKNTNKTATKLCASEDEANKYILELGDTKNQYRIDKREGIDRKCTEYCICNSACSYYIEKYGKK